jgi:hypothetical protein
MRYRWLVALYPETWRERYEEEFLALLEDCPLSCASLIDVMVSALDAHLHSAQVFGRMLTMLQRLRSTAITVFCAYIVFVLAGLGYWNMTEDYVERLNVHPAIALSYYALQAGAIIGLLAVLAGGLPIALAVAWRAFVTRQWRPLLLLAVPPISLAVWIGYTMFILQLSQALGNVDHTHPLNRLVGLSWIGLFHLAAAASTTAVVVAVRQSQISLSLFQFARIPAVLATLSMAGMLVATIAWGVALKVEVPQVFNGAYGIYFLGANLAVSWLLIIVVMAGATAVAAVSTWRVLSLRRDHDTPQTLARQSA